MTSVVTPITRSGCTPSILRSGRLGELRAGRRAGGARVGVAGFAHRHNLGATHAYVALDHPQHRVEHHGVEDDQIQRARGRDAGGLPHALAHRFAAAEQAFVAVVPRREVALHLQQQLRVGQTHPVAHGGPKQRGVLRAA